MVHCVISPNFLVCKFCEKTVSASPELHGNCAFRKNFQTREIGEIKVFNAMVIFEIMKTGECNKK